MAKWTVKCELEYTGIEGEDSEDAIREFMSILNQRLSEEYIDDIFEFSAFRGERKEPENQ